MLFRSMHVLAQADFAHDQGKQQVTRYTKALGIGIVDGVEVAGDAFGKVTGLLAAEVKAVCG